MYQGETTSDIATGGSESLHRRGFRLTQNEIAHRVQLFNNLKLPISGNVNLPIPVSEK